MTSLPRILLSRACQLLMNRINGLISLLQSPISGMQLLVNHELLQLHHSHPSLQKQVFGCAKCPGQFSILQERRTGVWLGHALEMQLDKEPVLILQATYTFNADRQGNLLLLSAGNFWVNWQLFQLHHLRSCSHQEILSSTDIFGGNAASAYLSRPCMYCLVQG